MTGTFDGGANGHCSFIFVFQNNKKTHSVFIFISNAFKGGHQQAGRKRDKEWRMKDKDTKVLRLGFITRA